MDSREQNEELKSIADKVHILRYAGPNNEPYSFDVRITNEETGQVFTYEIKRGADLTSSFSKLERQVVATDGLIIEGFNPKALLLTRGEDPKFTRLLSATKKRVWRLAHSRAVIFTENCQETIAFLKYMEGRESPVDVRETRSDEECTI